MSRAITFADLLNALGKHVGAERGVSAENLVLEMQPGLSIDEMPGATRRLRAVISALREEGIAICGLPSGGYYLAENRDDLERTCRFLRSRAMHSLRQESKLRKLSMPELLGQMSMELQGVTS